MKLNIRARDINGVITASHEHDLGDNGTGLIMLRVPNPLGGVADDIIVEVGITDNNLRKLVSEEHKQITTLWEELDDLKRACENRIPHLWDWS